MIVFVLSACAGSHSSEVDAGGAESAGGDAETPAATEQPVADTSGVTQADAEPLPESPASAARASVDCRSRAREIFCEYEQAQTD